jgi:hypothetical protein
VVDFRLSSLARVRRDKQRHGGDDDKAERFQHNLHGQPLLDELP